MIELPSEHIIVESLIIKKPMTLVGKPGTVLQVNGGNILVDFSLAPKDQ